MKKKYVKVICAVTIILLFITGCKKELVVNYFPGHFNDACQLMSSTSEFGDFSYTYNRWGLLDQYRPYYYDGYFKMEYDLRGRLVKSRFYSNQNTLTNTIIFLYQDDHVVKETWYDGDTQTKDDEIFYTFNSKGEVIKSESFIQNYSSIYKYTWEGDVAEWDLYINGIISYTQQYTYYLPHHKRPDLAVHGPGYDFTATNGWLSADRWYSTSEKDISYDEEGNNPEVILDQDPHKTVVHYNEHDYVTSSDFYDKLTNTYVTFNFDYANCGEEVKDNTPTKPDSIPVKNIKVSPLQFLNRGSQLPIKNRMKLLHSKLKMR